MKELNQFYKDTLIQLIDKEIEELENHEFTFYPEREISYIEARPSETTAFDWFSHGQFHTSTKPYQRVVVSEEQAKFNREFAIPMEINDSIDIYKRIELLKDIKKLLEENSICLKEL